MSDEKLKEEIKQVVTNLGNIKFTVEDELEFCKQVLKRKEQECEELKQRLHQCWNVENSFVEQLDQLKAILAKIKKIAEHSILLDCNGCPMEDYCEELCSNENNFQEVILQKISECEVENDSIKNDRN